MQFYNLIPVQNTPDERLFNEWHDALKGWARESRADDKRTVSTPMEQRRLSETFAPRAAFIPGGVRVFTKLDCLVFTLLTCLSAAMFVSFLLAWFSRENWFSHPVSFSILTLIILTRVANSQVRWFSLPFMKRPRPTAPRSGLKVGVVTTIVPGAESLEMLEETVMALAALDYPHETWVLDEEDSEEVKAICRRNGVNHFSRKNFPQYLTESGHFRIRLQTRQLQCLAS